MNQQTKEFREKIANEFIKSLEEEKLDWKKNWKALSMAPQNAVTNVTYKGLNRFNLMFLCNANEWEDPRFATFKQISDKGWHLKKGSHGCKVEYWMPYNVEEKRVIPWKEADLKDKNIKLIAKYYHVFNAKDIEGIPPMELPEKRNINPDKILETICKNMDIEILNDGGNSAFYRPSEDKIHLPEAGYFESDYAYNSVALHELSHATGAAHRLNRNLQNLFGSPDYAFEELVAEISSTFMSQDLASCCNGFEMDNHKAYIQSWISAIKDKPEILMQAIKEANRAADYLEVAAELVKEQKLTKAEAFEIGSDKIYDESEKQQQFEEPRSNELDKLQESIIGHEDVVRDMKTLGFELRWVDGFSEDGFVSFHEINNSEHRFGFDGWEEVNGFVEDVYKMVDNFSLEDLTARANGYYGVIEYGMIDDNTIKAAVDNYDKLLITRDISFFYETAVESPSWLEVSNELTEGGEAARQKYAKDIADYIASHNGELSQETVDCGNAIIKYLSGYETLQKGSIETGISHDNIVLELKKNGFRPTRSLVNNIQEFNAVTGRNNSLADICEMHKSKELDIKPDAKELLEKISSECRVQELTMALEQ